MRQALYGSLKEFPADPAHKLNRVALLWPMVVGQEIAMRTRLHRLTEKTIFVEVEGQEWVPVVKSLESKILAEIKKNSDFSSFTRIALEAVPASKTPKKVNESSSAPKHPYRGPAVKGNLEMIKDLDLRNSLERIGHKLRFVTLILLGSIFLSNCSTTPSPQNFTLASAVEDDDTSQFARSYAVQQIKAIKKHQPDAPYRDPRAYYHFLLSLKYEREGDFDQAAFHYLRVVTYDPNNEKFYSHLMHLFLRTGQYEPAVQTGLAALQKFPGNVAMRMIVGDILSAQGKRQEAIDHYKKIIKADPSNGRAYLMVGNNLDILKENEEAIENFKQATLTDPANPLGYHYLGKTLTQAGKDEEAIEKYKKALSLRPSLVHTRKNLAWVYELQNQYEQAIQQYKIILKLQPKNKKIRKHLEEISLAFNSAGGAPLDSSSLPKLVLEEVNIHTKLGSLLYEQASYLQALDEFRQVLAEGEKEEIRLIIARIFELFGRMDKAINEVEAYRKSVNALPVEILLHLARLYGLDGQMEKSIELLNDAVTRDSDNDRLHHALALANMALNRNEEAISHIGRAITLDDQKDVYYFEQGALLERVGQYDGAIQSMQRALELNPKHSNAHNFIGYMYATTGADLDKAVHHLEQALSIQPRNGYFLDSMGWIYFKKGQSAEALTHLKKAMIYTEPDPVLYDHLGDVYFSLKRVNEAHKAWETSLVLTRKRLENPSGEIPDPNALEEKIQQAEQILQNGH